MQEVVNNRIETTRVFKNLNRKKSLPSINNQSINYFLNFYKTQTWNFYFNFFGIKTKLFILILDHSNYKKIKIVTNC